MGVATAGLITRARAGDGDAFRELTEPYRRELQVHCYRMLGSFQDAEDALQETLMTAWQGLGGFEERASLRTWLILRDVLGYHADEVAGLLDSTVESVNSALKRARASLQRRLPPAGERESPPAPGSPAEQALAARFARAYGSGDIDALVALLTEDVAVSMPPVPLEWHGRDDVARFYASIMRQGRVYDLAPTRANGQLAFGTYLHSPDGVRRGAGLLVLALAGDRICALTRFDTSVVPWFGLPRSLPA